MKSMFSGCCLAALLLFAISASAMPPHPDLLAKVQRGTLSRSILPDLADIHSRGIDAPNRVIVAPVGDEVNTSMNILVLLVDFSDNPSTAAQTFFNSLIFGASQPSVAHFYSQISYGSFSLTTANLPAAVGWLRMPQPYSYYVGTNNGMGTYPNNSQKLAEDAVAAANSVVNFAQYDADGNGYLDGIIILHSGSGAEVGAENSIWSHAWSSSVRPTVDGKRLSGYCTVPEYWYDSGDMTIGVIAHELGHSVLGLPDLYDYDYSSEGVGNWSLMAGGSWNGTMGSSPAMLDAWSRVEAGFSTPTVVSSATTLSLPASETNARVYKATMGLTDEYFLIENRQQTSYDVSLPSSGMLIYHIDDAVNSNDNEWYPTHTTSGHYHVALEQADGLFELEQGSGSSDAGDPFPGSSNVRGFSATTTPNSLSYTANAGIGITSISNSGATMTASLSNPSLPNGISLTTPNGGESWMEGSVQSIVWTSAGVTGNVNIYLKRTPTSTWATLASNISNTGTYNWTVTTPTTTQGVILVRSVSNTNQKDTSSAYFSIVARPRITVTNPNGGNVYRSGSGVTIQWTSTNVSASENVRIELNRTYPTGSWETLVDQTPNDGTQLVTLSGTGTTTARIRVRSLTITSANDTSNANFSLYELAVTSPNGGESWMEGSVQPITWTMRGLTGNVNVYVKRTPSSSWTTLASNISNSGRLNWTVSTPASSQAIVCVQSVANTANKDTSNGYFTIVGKPKITVTAPNGGNILKAGSSYTVTWTSANVSTSSNVKIEVNRTYPSSSWEAVNASTVNDGSQLITLPSSGSNTTRIRVISLDNSTIGDTSNANFTLYVVAVTSPNGGESWIVGTVHPITWSTRYVTGNVDLYIKRTPTSSWTLLVSNIANTGSRNWTVSSPITSQAVILVRMTSNTAQNDTSNAYFTVRTASSGSPIASLETTPIDYRLQSLAPNPFNRTLTLRFDIPEGGEATMTIHDVMGRKVADLWSPASGTGHCSATWKPEGLASGTYLIRMTTPSQTFLEKVVYLP